MVNNEINIDGIGRHRVTKKPGKRAKQTKFLLPSKKFLRKYVYFPAAFILFGLTIYFLTAYYYNKENNILLPPKLKSQQANSYKNILKNEKEIYFPLISRITEKKANIQQNQPFELQIFTSSLTITESEGLFPSNVDFEGDFLKGKKIVIDPGHGDSNNLGSVGATGLREIEVVLDVAKRLENLLKENGVIVVLTRRTLTTSLNNVQRGQLANSENAGIFLRIHSDSNPDKTISGTQTLWFKDNSKEAAKIFQQETVEGAGLKDLGTKKVFSEGFEASNVPSISVDIAKISNPSDELQLKNPIFRQKVALALYNAIKKFYLLK